MQEYIFVHPEERFARKPLFGIFRFILLDDDFDSEREEE